MPFRRPLAYRISHHEGSGTAWLPAEDTMQDSDSSGGGGAIVAIMFLVVLGLYFIPTIVAFVRHVPDRGTVIVLNLFLGWTFIGWVVALSMAARSRPPTMVVVPQPVMLGHASPQPGWYRDPSDPGAERWWDGVAWSEARRALP